MNITLKNQIRSLRQDFNTRIAEALVNNPNRTYRQIAADFGTSIDWVIDVAKEYGITRPRGRKPGVPNTPKTKSNKRRVSTRQDREGCDVRS